ncbi:MAG TPA: radical SAM protein [Clostridia bacterium]|nr:radical SAM protein [Clostridia bacterium]
MNFIIKTTGKCNLRCRYCSLGDKSEGADMSIATLCLCFDKIVEFLARNNERKCAIIFHGGEPTTLSADFYRTAIEYTRLRYAEYEFDWKIQTNGTLINEGYISLFKDYDFSVGISIDGTRDSHDRLRIRQDGTGTYDVITSNIERLRTNNVRCAVLLVQNALMKDSPGGVLGWFTANDLDIRINPIIACGEAANNSALLLDKGDYARFLIEMFRLAAEAQAEIAIRPVSEMLSAVINGTCMSECTFSDKCCKAFMCITENGDIYPCGRFSDLSAMRIGNIKAISLIEAYEADMMNSLRERKSTALPEECIECNYINLCFGGCPAEAMAQGGDFRGKSCFCEDYKLLYQYLHTEGLELVEKKLKERRAQLEKLLLCNNGERSDEI